MKSIILDDGIEYFIIKDLKINDNTYTLFANVDNEEDICFRKTTTKNGKEYYEGLDSKKELDLVLTKFSKYMLEHSNEE